MFKWLFGGGDESGTFSPKKRLLYRYFNGAEIVRADPMVLYKKVMDVGPELAIDMKVAGSPLKDATKAHGKVVEKIRKIFNLKPFEHGGLSEIEATDLLDHFLTYCEDVKKNMNSPMTLPKETTASTPASSGDKPVMPPPSVTGSTDAGASTGQPASSPMGQPSPSAS